MTSRTHPVKYTYEDYLRFPDDGKRYEIIDGELYVTPAPNLKHQAVLGNLYRLISVFLKANRLGKAFLAPTDVIFSNQDIVQPDLIFVSSANLEILTEKNVRGAPDLAIEVLSPSTRRTDRGAKRMLYERAGVQEYWIVDPFDETISVYRRSGPQGLAALADVRRPDVLVTPLLPGLDLPADEIFET